MRMMPTAMAQPYCSMPYSSRSRRRRHAREPDQRLSPRPERASAGARMTDMVMRVLLAAALLGVTPARAQLSRHTFGGLPRWADSALATAGLGRQFTLSSQVNSTYEFADFDGDGLSDVAVEIKDTGGLRYGIAIVHRIDRSVHVVGAGQPIGNGKDQLNWRASWGVASPRHVRGYGGFGPDLLYINQPGAPSRWVLRAD